MNSIITITEYVLLSALAVFSTAHGKDIGPALAIRARVFKLWNSVFSFLLAFARTLICLNLVALNTWPGEKGSNLGIAASVGFK